MQNGKRLARWSEQVVVRASKADRWMAREWSELGFYYDYDEFARKWRVHASHAGALRLTTEITKFASDPENDWVSSHVNLGPYSYLKFGVFESAEINKDWIAAPVSELKALAEKIEVWVLSAEVGDCLDVRSIFSGDSEHGLEIILCANDFIPWSLDSTLKGLDFSNECK